jgi:membrane protein DedA with SNARE-associated domain
MEFIKRKNICDICTSTLWWIPLITYLSMKLFDMLNEQREWIWWAVIPMMFIIWILINWKIKFKKNDI